MEGKTVDFAEATNNELADAVSDLVVRKQTDSQDHKSVALEIEKREKLLQGKCQRCKNKKAILHIDGEHLCPDCFTLHYFDTAAKEMEAGIKHYEPEDYAYEVQRGLIRKAEMEFLIHQKRASGWKPTSAWKYNVRREWINFFECDDGGYVLRARGGVHPVDFIFQPDELDKWVKQIVEFRHYTVYRRGKKGGIDVHIP